MFWFLGYEACGILAAQPGLEPTHPALEGKVLKPLDHQGCILPRVTLLGIQTQVGPMPHLALCPRQGIFPSTGV